MALIRFSTSVVNVSSVTKYWLFRCLVAGWLVLSAQISSASGEAIVVPGLIDIQPDATLAWIRSLPIENLAEREYQLVKYLQRFPSEADSLLSEFSIGESQRLLVYRSIARMNAKKPRWFCGTRVRGTQKQGFVGLDAAVLDEINRMSRQQPFLAAAYIENRQALEVLIDSTAELAVSMNALDPLRTLAWLSGHESARLRKRALIALTINAVKKVTTSLQKTDSVMALLTRVKALDRYTKIVDQAFEENDVQLLESLAAEVGLFSEDLTFYLTLL